MTRTEWNALSYQGRIAWLLQYQVASALPQNRPEITVVNIPVTNTNDVVLSDLLVNYQVCSIVGFTSAGVQSRTTGLAAKIASIAGGTWDEWNYINEAVLQSPGFSATGLIYSIITSTNITITLTGGHGLQELHFYCLPASYLEQSGLDNDLF